MGALRYAHTTLSLPVTSSQTQGRHPGHWTLSPDSEPLEPGPFPLSPTAGASACLRGLLCACVPDQPPISDREGDSRGVSWGGLRGPFGDREPCPIVPRNISRGTGPGAWPVVGPLHLRDRPSRAQPPAIDRQPPLVNRHPQPHPALGSKNSTREVHSGPPPATPPPLPPLLE